MVITFVTGNGYIYDYPWLPLIATSNAKTNSRPMGETSFYLSQGRHPATPPVTLGLPTYGSNALEMLFQQDIYMEFTLTRIWALLKGAQAR